MTRTQLVALVAAQHATRWEGLLTDLAKRANDLVKAVEAECHQEARDTDMARLIDVLQRVGR